MKKIVLGLLLVSAFSLCTPAFAAPPPPNHEMNHAVHAGHHAPPPPVRMHNRVHGGMSFNMAPRHCYGNSYYGNVHTIGMNYYNCPSYGVCRPFRHPGPQFSTGFYVSF